VPPDSATLLLVERDGDATQALIASLRRHALEVVWVRDDESALNALERAPLQAVMFALHAPRIDGLTVLRRALELHPAICALAIADPSEAGLADEAVMLGVADVQARPVRAERAVAVIQRGLAQQRRLTQIGELEARLDRRHGFEQLDARSRAMRRVLEQVRQVAPTRASVLIEGPEGAGKSRLAETIHQHSPRRGARFVWLSCAALGEAALERELFGSGESAASGTPGRIELAAGGTLFLEDIERIPPAVQVRLLRVLHDRVFERVGGGETRRADIRLIAATPADLEAEVRAGRFRDDLWVRLSLVRVHMPPLSERAEDLPFLVESFIREFNREHSRRVTGVTAGVLERLAVHHWPGNVRELKNTIEGMVVFAAGRRPLELSDLPQALRGDAGAASGALAAGMTVEEAERALISATLRHTGFDKTRTAAMLGIGLRTLYRKIRRYGLAERPENA
jgi:DNA-binding NtrC family response regulator